MRPGPHRKDPDARAGRSTAHLQRVLRSSDMARIVAHPLYTLHRVLMITAGSLGGIFGLFCGYRYRATGEPMLLIAAGASVATSVGIVFYLRWFAAKRTGKV